MVKTRKNKLQFSIFPLVLHLKALLSVIGQVEFFMSWVYTRLSCIKSPPILIKVCINVTSYSKYQWSTTVTTAVLHCDSIITRLSGSTGKNPRYNGSRYIYTRPLFKIFNATSFTCFHYVNKCPTHRHLVWDISVFSFMVITHKLFINRGINRCMFVE